MKGVHDGGGEDPSVLFPYTLIGHMERNSQNKQPLNDPVHTAVKDHAVFRVVHHISGTTLKRLSGNRLRGGALIRGRSVRS